MVSEVQRLVNVYLVVDEYLMDNYIHEYTYWFTL